MRSLVLICVCAVAPVAALAETAPPGSQLPPALDRRDIPEPFRSQAGVTTTQKLKMVRHQNGEPTSQLPPTLDPRDIPPLFRSRVEEQPRTTQTSLTSHELTAPDAKTSR